jgi:cell division protease FtsH
MTVLLGGRAAESLIFGEISTGASDDIARASNIAREMVTRYGMDAGLGHVAYEYEKDNFLGLSNGSRNRFYSDQSAQKIDFAVRELVNRALDRALGILGKNLDILRSSAEKLLAQETLTEEDLKGIFSNIVPYQWAERF